MPRGHWSGTHNASHFRSVRFRKVLEGLMCFSFKEALKESLR